MSYQSAGFEDEISPALELKREIEVLIPFVIDQGGSVVDIVGLFVFWTNYHCPVAPQHRLQLHLYRLRSLILVVPKLLAGVVKGHNQAILYVFRHRRPVDRVDLGLN